MTNIQIQQIPAFDDNYLWLIHNCTNAIIVDPGDAAPVQAYLNQHQLQLSAILLTHHHPDHIGGVAELLNNSPKSIPVYGALADQQSGRIAAITQGCRDGDTISIAELDLQFNVIDVPGHTSTHIAYYCAQLASLFCGDTLFAGGCGRLFEGTPEQMLHSLQKLAALPSQTKVFCAHEYTLSNLRFAVAVEPNNPALQTRFKQVTEQRANNISTVPSQIATEIATNPFLRSDSADIIQTLQAAGKLGDKTDPVSVFAAVRGWKNTF